MVSSRESRRDPSVNQPTASSAGIPGGQQFLSTSTVLATKYATSSFRSSSPATAADLELWSSPRKPLINSLRFIIVQARRHVCTTACAKRCTLATAGCARTGAGAPSKRARACVQESGQAQSARCAQCHCSPCAARPHDCRVRRPQRMLSPRPRMTAQRACQHATKQPMPKQRQMRHVGHQRTPALR